MVFRLKRRTVCRILPVIAGCLLLLINTAVAQNRAELEKKKKQLNQDIEYTNKVLHQTQKEKASSLKGLRVLNSQISTREKVIGTINTQIKVMDNEIGEKTSSIAQLKADLDALKKEYEEMILFAFRNQGAYSKLMFVFAAKDFNQAFKRMKYMQQFGEYRRSQAEHIKQAQQALNMKVVALSSDKKEKGSLLQEEQKERNTLTKEKQKQNQVVGQLQSKEKNLKQDLAKKKREAEKVNKTIQGIIRREIEAARKKAEEEARRKAAAAAAAKGEAPPTTVPKSATGTAALSATPESAKLSADFAGSRGSLPWPVAKGVIVERFGVHPHPVLARVQVNNDGVTIKTAPGSAVRAVFAGEVTAVVSMDGSPMILIKHGEYFSVYSNLRSASVKKGDKVSLKQTIGVVDTDADGNAELNFQLWKGNDKQNPEPWLAN